MKKYAILACAALALLAGCSDDKPKEVAKVEAAASAVAAAPEEPAEKPTGAQQLDAMTRPYERMTKVCIDGLRDRAFFVFFVPATKENQLEGWYHVEAIDFYKTSNNTWFIGDIPDNKWFKAYPDITGLQCKDKNVTTP